MKNWIIIGAFLAAVAVLFGAFGAHLLKSRLPTEYLNTFETGVRYQMYHCLALLVVGFAAPISSATKKWTFRFFLFGIIFFSGSIYLLALKEVLPFDVSFLGPITPIGGLFFIVGWLWLARGLYSLK